MKRKTSDKKTLVLKKPDDWQRVVEAILPTLKPGTILALAGPLGAGKTTFVQYLAHALGVRRPTPSPTFALIRSYKLQATNYKLARLIHVDAYRLHDGNDRLALDLDEELNEPGTLLAVEWPENLSGWIKRHHDRVRRLTIQVIRDHERRVTRS